MSGPRGRLAGRRERIPTHSSLMITSMLDMFTIILVFLLNFLDPANESDGAVSLPEAKAEESAGEGVVLTVTPERVLVAGEEVLGLFGEGMPLPGDSAELGALRDRLTEARAALGQDAKASAATEVLAVHCDRRVPFSVLGALLSVAGEAGFSEFRFVVIRDSG